MASGSDKKSALFICLGNICRSPIAEAVFNHVASEKGVRGNWNTDSAAIGDWHVGKKPDKRAQDTMSAHNIEMDHRARTITREDFNRYDFIFGMDEQNMRDLEEIAPKNHKAKIVMLGLYDPQKQLIIRDPYYDNGAEGFEEVYQQCVRCCTAFLEKN